MRDFDPSTPVVVLNAKLAALGIMRSLGKKGVAVHAVDGDRSLPAMRSRYCAEQVIIDLETATDEEILAKLAEFGARLGKKAVLFWTSDETAVLCAEHYDYLSQWYLMPKNDVEVIDGLQNKGSMFRMAIELGVPTPHTEFPQSEDDVRRMAGEMRFPIMLKAIIGSRLFARTGKKMQLAHDMDELLELYGWMEDPDEPNLMLQEAIPGDDDEVYIFNGYFDGDSLCGNPYTGHKIRQYPIHVGAASLGICLTNEEVSRTTQDFMKAISYQGILDIGYRLDPRDGKYKVLDVNPRIGQAFRIFVGEENEDVCRDLYLDLTGQAPVESTPREGRCWVIEVQDLISSYDYRREGTLTVGEWLRSFSAVQECAWWWWRDPLPALVTWGVFFRSQLPRRILGVAKRVRRLAPGAAAG